MDNFQKPPPLEIKCTSTDCDNDLHCFKQLKKMTPEQRGKCRACSADLVDWKRLHRRDRGDAAHTFGALQREMIRHHFFHRPVDEHAVRHAQRKGRVALKESVRDRLNKYLAVAEPPRDGRQTPLQGNAIYYAQHATATCCRTCLEYWHDIPKGRRLTTEEFDYCATLVDLFLDLKLPNLADQPTKVSRRQGLPPEPEALSP
ncbi:DUF4186 family protein [Bradyrhizobium sp. OK095]|uniref:DUF4186 family protein n=1 Tax=Bradyrhizobium sp. OK095 TaxID=1882760 RepID=UPI0008C9562A|nr:DUF4186 family protein [Bradyrhizobium sp. OK095]SEM70778.1 protein of unknown function [Bradyrhizobium sp. OK095]